MIILTERHTKNHTPVFDTLAAVAIHSASSVSSLCEQSISRICLSLTPWYAHVTHTAHRVSDRFRIPKAQSLRQTHLGPSRVRSTHGIEDRSLSILWRGQGNPQRSGSCARERRVSRTYSGPVSGPLHTRLAPQLRRR